jgi:hypothetical protein
MATDYEWDVFFSYQRHNFPLNWLREVRRNLDYWLSEELGRPV